MADFDMDAYLRRRPFNPNGTDKLLGLEEASQKKIAALAQYSAEKQAHKEASKDSWVNKLNLESDSIGGGLVNLGASLYSGTSRVVGQVASLPFALSSFADEFGMQEADVEAYNRYVSGKAKPEDMALLSQKQQAFTERDLPEVKARAQARMDSNPNAPTKLQLFERAAQARDTGRNISEAFDRSDVVQKDKRAALTADLGDEFQGAWDQTKEGWSGIKKGEVASGGSDAVAGVAKLLFNAGEAALTNPGASSEYIVENIPQLAVGLLGKAGKAALAASNVGYAADNYQQGIQKYQQDNQGALPPAEQRQEMAMYAASLALAEQVGDMSILKAIKPADAAKDAVRLGFKQSLKNVLGVTAKGIGTESATEGYQTFAEGEATLKPANAKDIYEGAVIGGIAGGGLSGGGRAISEVLGGTPEQVAARQQEVKDAVDRRVAIATNDPSPYLQEGKEDPVKAVEVLLGNNQLETSTADSRASNIAQAQKIVSDLESKRDSLFESTTAGVEQSRELIAHYKARLATAAPEEVGDIQNVIDVLSQGVAGFEAMSPKEVKAAQKAFDDLDAQYQKAQEVTGQLNQAFQPKEEEITSLVEAVNAPVDPKDESSVAASKAAVEKILVLSMASPAHVSAEVASSLASNPNVAPEIQSYFRQLSENKVAENAAKQQRGVHKEVFEGKPAKDGKRGEMGIAQYRDQVGRAIAAGDQKTADRLMKLLGSFISSHSEKSALMQDSFAKAKAQRGYVTPYQWLRTADGRWELNTGNQLSDTELAKNGGFNVHKGSENLVSGVGIEAKALTSLKQELNSAYGLKFTGSVPSTGTVPSTQSTQNISVSSVDTAVENSASNQSTVDSTVNPVEGSTDVNTAAEINQKITEKEAEINVLELREERLGKLTELAITEAIEAGLTPEDIIEALSPYIEFTEQDIKNVIQKLTTTDEAIVEPTQESQVQESQESSDVGDRVSIAEAGTESSSPSGEGQANSESEEDVVTTEPTAEGKLSVFSQFNKALVGKPLQEIFRNVNLVAQFIKQSGLSERYKSQRPLVAVKDFLSQWKAKPDLAYSYVQIPSVAESADDRYEQQRNALSHIRKTLDAWLPKFQSQFSLAKLGPDFRSQDMLQHLLSDIDGKVDSDENLKTAMAYAAYHWILVRSNSPLLMDPEAVLTMHGRDKDDILSQDAHDFLADKHGFENTVLTELGDIAAQVLGLQSNPNAPQDLLPKLKTAMGSHILLFLEKEGIVQRTSVPAEQVLTMLETGDVLEINSELVDQRNFDYVTFVFEPANTKAGHISPKQIKDANVGSSSIIEKLFGVEDAPRMASIEPVEFKQAFAKKTQQGISKMQRKVIEQTMKIPHKVIPGMFALVEALGRDVVLRIAGAQEVNEDRTHVVNRKSIEAQNQNLGNQFDLMMEMLLQKSNPNGIDTEFYVEGSIWKNYRAGFTNQSMNLQTSKIHRAMFSRPDWTVTLDLNNQDMVNEFKIAVMMNLGLVKTDKQINQESLGKFENILKEKPEVLQAIEAIRQRVEKDSDATWTQQNIDLIEKVASKEGMLGLQSMLAYAQYLDAVENGDTSFTTTLLVGADGKTNGPMLSHLALGAAPDIDGLYAILNRGGMYSTADNQPKHFSEYAQGEKSMDLYEHLMSKVLEKVRDNIKSFDEIMAGMKKNKILREQDKKEQQDRKVFDWITPEAWNAFQVLTGQLEQGGKVASAGRNLAKTPLTSFSFGSKLEKSIKNMENAFVQKFHDTIQDLAQGNRTDITLSNFIKEVNALIKVGDYKASPLPNMSLEQALNFDLAKHPKQDEALRKAFTQVIGKSVYSAMNTEFRTFISRRNAVNQAIQASFVTYQEAYASLRQKEMERLMASGEVAYRVQTEGLKNIRVPIHDLTQAQEAELHEKIKDLLPVIHTNYSLQEKNLDAGIFMAKSEFTATENPLYASRAYVKGGVSHGSKHRQYMAGSPMVRNLVSPGVAGLPYMIHSSDSYIMHSALQAAEQALNVHDEISTSVLGIAPAAEAINKATVETFLNYSPAREAANMLEKLVIALAKKASLGEIDSQSVNNVLTAWTNALNRGIPEEHQIGEAQAPNAIVTQALYTAFEADSLRLQAIASMSVMDQYTWEGGQFVVTPEIRQQAEAMLAKLNDVPSKTLTRAIAYLEGVAQGKEKAEATTPEWVDKAKSTPEQDDVTVAVTDLKWGKLGDPTTREKPRDQRLMKAFEAKGFLTARELIALLKSHPVSGKNEFSMSLLDKIANTVSSDLVIKYVTPNTQSNELMAGPNKDEPASGWTAVGNNKTEIYVLSPEFFHSNLTTELLLHELVHASVGRVIQRVEASATDPKVSVSADEKALVDELEKLREMAYRAVAAKKAWAFKHAVVNVQELVAYGMTSVPFQRFLNTVNVETQNKGNKLVTAFQSFMEAITKFFLKTTKEQAVKGLETLFTNVSGLFTSAMNDQGNSESFVANQAAENNYTTLEVFAALESLNTHAPLSTAFTEQLQGVLSAIVSKLHGPFGTLMASRQQAVADAWMEAKQTQAVPFATEALVAGFNPTEQEAFVMDQVYATVNAALSGNTNATTLAYQELSKLYLEAKADINPADLHTDPVIAQAMYDFVFKMEASQGNRSDYLSRFAGMGLAHEGFNQALQKIVHRAKTAQAPKHLVERLQQWFDKALGWLAGMVTHTHAGQQANTTLRSLVDSLVDIEAKKRDGFVDENQGIFGAAESFLKGTSDSVRDKVAAFGQSSLFQNSKSSAIKLSGTVVTAVAQNRLFDLLGTVQKIRTEYQQKKNNLLTGIIDEASGFTDTNTKIHFLIMAAKNNERLRKEIMTYTLKTVLGSFNNNGQDLTDNDKSALTSVLLRNDLVSLLDKYDLTGIQRFLSNPLAVDKEIAVLEKQLTQYGDAKQYFVNQSRLLAYYMATGKNRSVRLMKNAATIAKMGQTSKANYLSEAKTSEATTTIDQLVSLYAIKYSDGAQLNTVSKLIRSEMSRGEGNGIATVLGLHKALQQESREKLFANGNEGLMIKGYMPEIYNPRNRIMVAPVAQEAMLKRQGYTPGALVAADPHDPNQTARQLYVMKDAGKRPWLSAALSLTGSNAKGSRAASTEVQDVDSWIIDQVDLKTMDRMKKTSVESLFKQDIDPTKVKDTYAAPILNAKGEISGYHYLMQNETKDNLLQRDNRFEHVLGMFQGNIYDKETAVDQNRKVIESLHEQYLAEYSQNSKPYVEISEHSADPEIREFYRLLPDHTKQAIKEVWKGEAMVVRRDLLDKIFGYRKLSLASLFEQNPALQNQAQKLLRSFLTHIFKEKAALYMNRYGDRWDEVVQWGKSNIVVKSYVVLRDNIISNFSSLLLSGVPIKDIIHHHWVILRAVVSYRKANDALSKLEIQLKANPNHSDRVSMEAEMVRLQDAIERNPAKELIDAGMMPTIVEDVASDDDIYSYGSQLSEKVDRFVAKVPAPLRKAGKLVYMTQDTQLYQMLSYGTQVSDFMARYTMYQHLTTKKDPLSKEEAMKKAVETFVNYDIPSHRLVQYLNDKGLFMFTKYYFRIQKVLMSLMRDNPARALGMLVFEHYFSSVPTLMDSSMLMHPHSPLNMGALMFPGTLDELVTVRAGKAVFN